MPELSLGLGRERGIHQGIEREWLYCYDQCYDQPGNRYPTSEERAEQAEERAERLAAKLRELNIDPDLIN
jgi:hypothetical protein